MSLRRVDGISATPESRVFASFQRGRPRIVGEPAEIRWNVKLFDKHTATDIAAYTAVSVVDFRAEFPQTQA